VRGIVLAAGAPTAHAAILARGLGLPLVVGAGDMVQQIATGEQVVLDGDTGVVLVAPEPTEIATHRAQMGTRAVAAASGVPEHGPARTADGRRVELHANASSVAEAQLALDHGAEGIGLLRTEFLLATLLDWTSLAEEALADAYEAILRAMDNRPVTVRAMDAGGDKPLPFLDFGQETNPFLGRRGVRVLLDTPDLFAGQTRALLRAAARCQTTARLLLPMVSDVEEFRRARALVDTVAMDADNAGMLQVGAMIEVPAAALLADALAMEADFFSLGTNDLVQYTLACDRGNPRVADRCRFLHPAVLRLVDMTVRAAHAAGRPVGVCGEAAGDPDAVPLLVGLGVDELSVGPARLSAVRNHLRTLRFDAAHQLAAEALRQATAQAVADLVAGR
jgi:phosphoenolpyruvate-protein phosphotransferase